jgi:hypothetical protein
VSMIASSPKGSKKGVPFSVRYERPTTHDRQCGTGNLQIMSSLGNTVSRQFAEIILCLDMQAFRAHEEVPV